MQQRRRGNPRRKFSHAGTVRMTLFVPVPGRAFHLPRATCAKQAPWPVTEPRAPCDDRFGAKLRRARAGGLLWGRFGAPHLRVRRAGVSPVWRHAVNRPDRTGMRHSAHSDNNDGDSPRARRLGRNRTRTDQGKTHDRFNAITYHCLSIVTSQISASVTRREKYACRPFFDSCGGPMTSRVTENTFRTFFDFVSST